MCVEDSRRDAESRQLERNDIVAWLRSGGETVRGQWYSWDHEMRGYYSAIADRIESADHLK